MRDQLCIEEKCKRGIEYHKEFIKENREEIRNLEEDEKMVFKDILMTIKVLY